METVEKDLARVLKALPKDHQRAFLSLQTITLAKSFEQHHSFEWISAWSFGSVFPNVSRINHSYKPNAKHSWNPTLEKFVMYTIRPLAEDQEIIVSYLPGGDSQQRQERLK
jgi:SET domain-containing protein